MRGTTIEGGFTVLADDEIARLQRRIQAKGPGAVAAALQIGREPLARAAAKMKIRRGTALAIRAGLPQLEEEGQAA
jgi:hypothetical protein